MDAFQACVHSTADKAQECPGMLPLDEASFEPTVAFLSYGFMGYPKLVLKSSKHLRQSLPREYHHKHFQTPTPKLDFSEHLHTRAIPFRSVPMFSGFNRPFEPSLTFR